MVLDDLQCAHSSSLELIQVLLTDQKHQLRSHDSGFFGLVIVGTYRSNEVDRHGNNETSVFQRALRDLSTEAHQHDNSFQMTSIEIGMKWGTALLDPDSRSLVTDMVNDGMVLNAALNVLC